MKTPWSSRTEEVRENVLEKEAGVIRELALAVNGRPCLDVGCGPRLLADHLSDYIGVDFEPEWRPDVIGDATALPFDASSVPVVVTKTTLQHIPDWRSALDELVRVARDEVILYERTWRETRKGTEVVHTEPVLRRRFNRADLFGTISTMDEITSSAAGTCNADDRIGVYRGRL